MGRDQISRLVYRAGRKICDFGEFLCGYSGWIDAGTDLKRERRQRQFSDNDERAFHQTDCAIFSFPALERFGRCDCRS